LSSRYRRVLPTAARPESVARIVAMAIADIHG
jgi:hypothetical protein